MSSCLKVLWSSGRRYLPIIGLLFLVLSWGSCGGISSPPVSLPVPIANLISAASPDREGVVVLTGLPGAVLPGAEINVAANSETQVLTWYDWLISSVRAQGSGSSTVAASDGSFQLQLQAQVGDQLEVSQESDTGKSPPLIVVVSGGVVRLATPPLSLGIDTTSGQLYVASGDGLDALVYRFDLNSLPLFSLPDPAFLFPGSAEFNRIRIDTADQRAIAIAPTQNKIFNFDIGGILNEIELSLVAPLDLTVLSEINTAFIGVQGAVQSIFVYPTDSSVFACFNLITHPTQPSAHLATRYLQSVKGVGGSNILVALSEFSDGSWVLSQITFTGCPVGFTTDVQIELASGVRPGGLAVFEQGGKALVTDTPGNQLLLVDFNTQAISNIAVGNGPVGVAFNPNNNRAYVANSLDNSISSVDVSTQEVNTEEAIALEPLELTLDPNLNLGAVISAADQSVVIFDLDF